MPNECPLCAADTALSEESALVEAEGRIERAVWQLHLARQAFERAGNSAAAQVLSEAVWSLEAVPPRLVILSLG